MKRERERETGRQRERDRERNRQTDSQRNRQTDRETERERETGRQRETGSVGRDSFLRTLRQDIYDNYMTIIIIPFIDMNIKIGHL